MKKKNDYNTSHYPMSSQRRLSCEANIGLITFQLFSIVLLRVRELEQLASTILAIYGNKPVNWHFGPRPDLVRSSDQKSVKMRSIKWKMNCGAIFHKVIVFFVCTDYEPFVLEIPSLWLRKHQRSFHRNLCKKLIEVLRREQEKFSHYF